MQQAARNLHALGFRTLPIRKGSKVPSTAHGVKDATADDAVTDSWYAEHPNDGIGVSGDGFIIFDFDVHDGIDGRDALIGWDLPDTLCQTTPSGGYHMIYRTDREVHPSVNTQMAVDVRGWHSYIVCDPTPGYVFEDDREPAIANEAVYRFLEYVQPKKAEPSETARETSTTTVAEGGRNDYLFRQGCSIWARYPDNKKLLSSALHTLNEVNCEPPLTKQEVDKIVKSVLEKPAGLSDEAKASKKKAQSKKFDHASVAERLITERGACFIDGMPAIRRGDSYEIGWNAISKEIIAMERNATRTNQAEVHHYLLITAEHKQRSRPTLIAFKNGVLDITNMELRPFEPTDVIPNIIPHNWIPDAQCKIVDDTLMKMACCDLDTLESLIEVMGVCMYSSAEFAQAAILLGEGSNGKSTYIRMLQALLGKRNISSLDLSMVGKQFHTGQLAGKLANLGDDISNEFQRGDVLMVFKKVVDGDRIYTDVKGTEGYEFEPYATLVFSANEFPRLADYSDGMMRRLFPIEFNATFKRGDPDYNPRTAALVTSEEACEYMCTLGIQGLLQVIAHNGFTPNAASEKRTVTILNDNNTVDAWVDEIGYTSDDVDGAVVQAIYDGYKNWCLDGNLQPVSRTKFTRLMNKKLGITAKVKRIGAVTKRCFALEEKA